MAAPGYSLTRISGLFVPKFPKLTNVTRPGAVGVYTTENLVGKKRVKFASDEQYDLWVLITLAGR